MRFGSTSISLWTLLPVLTMTLTSIASASSAADWRFRVSSDLLAIYDGKGIKQVLSVTPGTAPSGLVKEVSPARSDAHYALKIRADNPTRRMLVLDHVLKVCE